MIQYVIMSMKKMIVRAHESPMMILDQLVSLSSSMNV